MNRLEFNIVFWTCLLGGMALQWAVSNGIRKWNRLRGYDREMARWHKKMGLVYHGPSGLFADLWQRFLNKDRCTDCGKYMWSLAHYQYQTGGGKIIKPLCLQCFNKRMGM